MGDLVRLLPHVFLGRYLTVTSIDSGSPWLTDFQRAAGWELRSGVAYSRRISTSDELFYQRDGNDCPGYDEWYVFDTAPTHLGEILQGNPFKEGNTTRPGRLLVFASWGAFVLHDPDPVVKSITDMFWRQLNWVEPDVYISDGRECLTFVCKHEQSFRSVFSALVPGGTPSESETATPEHALRQSGIADTVSLSGLSRFDARKSVRRWR